jgi:SAM-dependent methyltransferase
VSFRDPGGALRFVNGTPLRFVRDSHASDLRAFLGSSTARQWHETGALVGTTELTESEIDALSTDANFRGTYASESWAGIWRHERIFFPSFAEEWTPGMLHRAGTLTLQLAADLLNDGYGLKDATPANILFRGAQPVFVDLLSIEKRDPMDPLWLPYAQFVRMFLLPLLVNKRTKLPLRAVLSVGREGLEPEAAHALLPLGARLLGAGLWHITLPMLVGGSSSILADGAPPKRSVPAGQAKFVLERLFSSLQRALDNVRPANDQHSSWTAYTTDHHSAEYFDAKRALVASAVEAIQPKTVLDIGCNTGELALIAAAKGADVVGIDSDPQVVERLFGRLAPDKLKILPLMVDMAAPTPARGWMNEESPSFLERAEGSFDLVLAMAVIHHLIATNGIPLARVLRLFALLTRDGVALEFVPPSDPLFRRLSRGRDHLYTGLTRSSFERACERHFEVLKAEPLPSGDRVAYLLRKRPP